MNELLPCIFKSNISNGLICSFCKNIFRNPVLATGCGHSFCSTCVETQKICPHDNKEFQSIIQNLSLEDQINQLEIYCRYGCNFNKETNLYELDTNGCQFIIKFGERNLHEDNCEYSFVSCPQNSKCPVMRKKDLTAHLEICQKISCHHSNYGCKFRGVPQELEEHLLVCPFEAIKDFIKQSEDRIVFLETKLAQSNKELDDYKRRSEQSRQALEESIVNITKDNNFLKENFQDMNEYINILARQYEVIMFQQNFRCLGTFVGHQGPVWCMCYQGDLLFTCSSDKTIKVWDISSEFLCVKTLEGHTEPILCLTIVNKRLYSGGKDNTIGEWSLTTLTNVQFIPNAHTSDYISALTGFDNHLYSGSNGSVKVWHIDKLKKGSIHEVTDLGSWVRCLAVKDNLLYIAGNTVQIRNLSFLNGLVNGSTYKSDCLPLDHEIDIPVENTHVHSMAFLDKCLVCGIASGDIYLWDINTRAFVNKITGHNDRINSLACVSIAGVWRIFSASNDRTIRVWRMDHMVCTQILARHQGSVQSVQWLKGRLFSAAVDTSIKVWVAGTQ